MFSRRNERNKHKAIIKIYNSVVRQSRRKEFYEDLRVADSLDGRFDILILHMILLFRRIKKEKDMGKSFSQLLFDHMFADFDESLREMGVGDLSVGKRVREMAEAFLGRVTVYEKGLNYKGHELEAALLRNVYRGVDPGREIKGRLAIYARSLDLKLETESWQTILNGELQFDDILP